MIKKTKKIDMVELANNLLGGNDGVYSNCCDAVPLTETNYYSDLDLITGLCSRCKDHCHFVKEGESDE